GTQTRSRRNGIVLPPRYHIAVATGGHSGNNRPNQTRTPEDAMKSPNVSRRKFLTTTVAATAAAAVAPKAATAKGTAPVAAYAGYLVYTKPGEEALEATEKDIEG